MAKKKAGRTAGGNGSGGGGKNGNGSGKALSTQQSVNSAVKSICDIMRRSNCAGAMQYVPELTWILFLRILDERESQEAEAAEIVGAEFSASLDEPYRWQDWAAPDGAKRTELTGDGSRMGDLFGFVNGELLPYLKGLRNKAHATPRQKVISEILSGVERVRIDTEKNFQDVLDKVHELSSETIDETHVFTLSQVYEGLLLKMGEKGGDGGQFFTPREVIRAVVQVVEPMIGETVYDPGCGTGGFLAQAYEFMAGKDHANIASPDDLDTLRHDTFFGREKENLIYPIALANLVLHGIDQPNLWHGNTLTRQETYDGLFLSAPPTFDVVLTAIPAGGKEARNAQTHFAFKTTSTTVLFVQHVLDVVDRDGRCGIVVDEGFLFRTSESAFVETKRRLLNDCDLYCVVSLPPGVYTSGTKTDILFFNRGSPTERIWYYDLSDIKVGKRTPFTIDRFKEFFKLLPQRGDSERSWTVDFVARKAKAKDEAAPFHDQAKEKEQAANQWKDQLKELKKAKPVDKAAVAEAETKAKELGKESRELKAKAEAIENAVYDLKAVNPNAQAEEDTRTPAELLEVIEQKGREISEALAALRN